MTDKYDAAFNEFMESDGKAALARTIAADLLDYEFASALMQRAFMAGVVWGGRDTSEAMLAAIDTAMKPKADA